MDWNAKNYGNRHALTLQNIQTTSMVIVDRRREVSG
jgi:hypothetical protein